MHGFVDSAEELEAKSPRQMIEYTMLHCLLLLAPHFISLKRGRRKKGFSKTASIRPMGDIFTPGIFSGQ